MNISNIVNFFTSRKSNKPAEPALPIFHELDVPQFFMTMNELAELKQLPRSGSCALVNKNGTQEHLYHIYLTTPMAIATPNDIATFDDIIRQAESPNFKTYASLGIDA